MTLNGEKKNIPNATITSVWYEDCAAVLCRSIVKLVELIEIYTEY